MLEVGGTHVTAARVDARSLQVDTDSVRRYPVDGAASADTILGAIAGAAGGVGPDHSGRWGVAMPGPFDYAAGIAWFSGVGKFDALYALDVRAELSARVRPAPVRLDFVNDADAFVLGEWAVGAVAGTSRCAGITLGTGIGSGFVVDGIAVHEGPGVPPGGRAHEISVDGVPLEDLVSRRAIRTAYAARTAAARSANGAGPLIDVAEISALARTGSLDAIVVLEAAMATLGAALGPYLARFEPDRVVIGGSMSASWDLYEPWFAAGCSSAGVAVPPTAVAFAATNAGLSGAAVHAARS